MARELSRGLAPGQLQPQKQPPASNKAAPGAATTICLPSHTSATLLCLLCLLWCSVDHHTQVKVKRRGSDTKYVARVLAIGVECDIALLTGNTRLVPRCNCVAAPGMDATVAGSAARHATECAAGPALLRLGSMLGQPPLRRAAVRSLLAVSDALGE